MKPLRVVPWLPSLALNTVTLVYPFLDLANLSGRFYVKPLLSPKGSEVWGPQFWVDLFYNPYITLVKSLGFI